MQTLELETQSMVAFYTTANKQLRGDQQILVHSSIFIA